MSYGLVISITFVVILVLIFLRMPIYSSLGIGGAVGIFLSRGMIGITQLPMSLMGQLVNFVMVAVPLFILMGEVLSKTGIGKDIYVIILKNNKEKTSFSQKVQLDGNIRPHRIGSESPFS
jgi:TRAP-type mannitol/chloroaromatic compound transport system permease large subunit